MRMLKFGQTMDITLLDKYTYLDEYNLILNNEFLNTFNKYSKNRKIEVKKFSIENFDIERNARELKHLIFEITQNCNLRCKYCPYTNERDFMFDRNRSNQVISLDIALKGLNYIYSVVKNRYNKEFTISFYGGEPLLRFDIIKKIVNHSKMLFKSWKLRYTITTNGTLISDEIIEFLVANDFTLLISLDGPQKNHDAKRVYPDNTGSFNDVYENILRIKAVNDEYFKKKLSFYIVYSKDLSLVDTFDFFLNNEIVNRNDVRFNFVNARHSNYYKNFPIEKDSFRRAFDEILGRIKKNLQVHKKLERPIEKEFSYRYIAELFNKEYSSLAGTCLFSGRLYLDVDGKFHICERINNKFPIGNIRDGLNYRKMQKILSDFFSITEKYCFKCDIKSLCAPCFVSFAENGRFKIDKEFCRLKRKDILKKLEEHVLQDESFIDVRKNDGFSKTKNFHQFIVLEKGPVNTAIIDLLKGNVFQVENEIIERFKNRQYKKIEEFIKSAEGEELILDFNNGNVVPGLINDKALLFFSEILRRELLIQLDIDEDIDIDLYAVKNKFEEINISQINYYGKKKIESIFPGVHINYKKKNFNNCLMLSKIDGNFEKIREHTYKMNRIYNCCWGRKIAISNGGRVTPCIYSEIVVGDIYKDKTYDIIDKAKKYWYITKDEVKKCQDCELRHVCFDCRVIAMGKGGNLNSPNPNCSYDPYKGLWGK